MYLCKADEMVLVLRELEFSVFVNYFYASLVAVLGDAICGLSLNCKLVIVMLDHATYVEWFSFIFFRENAKCVSLH